MRFDANSDEPQKIILRREQSATNSRYLSAEINADGDLVFEGQDLGKRVEDIFGYSEYEWVWTVKAKDLALFEKALGCSGDLLEHIERTFSHENAAQLYDFLQTHKIPFETWSRIGD